MSDNPGHDLLRAVQGALISDQGSKAILQAARLEKQLQLLLMTLMPKASKTLKDKLFDYPGALSTFSSKIELCFAMNLISAQLQADLHALRNIRNAFAHSVAVLDLRSEEIVKHLSKLSGWKNGTDPLRFFENVAARSSKNLIQAFKDRATHMQTLVDGAEALNQKLKGNLVRANK